MRFRTRSVWRWLLLSVSGVVAVAAVLGMWLWVGPLPLDWFLNRAFLQVMIRSPETMSALRIVEPLGFKAHQAELDDVSLKAEEEMLALLRKIHSELRSYDRAELSDQQKLSYDMADWFLTLGVEAAERFRFHSYPVNQLFGVQNEFPTFMDSSHQIHDERDARDYVTRLGKIDLKFRQVLEGLAVREQKKIIPPLFVVDKVLEEMRAFVKTEPEKNILYSSLKKKLEDAKLDSAFQKETLAEAKATITKVVYPAYGRLISYFERLRPQANADAGVWKLPDGARFYANMLELHTTTKLPPDQIHALGISEVARIQAEMRTILTAEGYDENRSVGELMKALAEEPRFLFPDNDAGRKQVLDSYGKIIREVEAGLSPWFNLKPKAKVVVERVPQFKEKTAPGGYYNPPPFDGSKPGTFYANLYDIKATPRFDMRTLAYHEAVPGHHFQIAIAMEQDLPLIRRLAPITAYAEGWALYAERLAYEAGFQKDPFDNLGRLQAELFRAVRLVVDTGIHHKRWTREEAIKYMSENTGMADSDVVAEIERYIVMPAQACAYKIGMLEILRLREKTRVRLGDRFDIRTFHDVVLKNGGLPLLLLERNLESVH